MPKLPKIVERGVRFFHLDSWFRLLMLCVLVGAVSGIGAVLFDIALKFFEHEVLTGWLFKPETPGWLLVLIPAAGACVAGALAFWFAPEARGHGTDSVIRAFHRNKGDIRARVPLVKGICSILTIGTGGSAGKEGPIAQIGAGFGSTLATMLKLSIRDRRILMLAGVAGGIGAIFKAPLGGALFAAEFLYREPDFEHDAVIPGVISSVTAYSVFTAIEGHGRILQFQHMDGISFPSVGGSTLELIHYAILSLLCAMVAFIFVKGLHLIEHGFFEKLPLPRLAKPAIGGAAVGALALILMTTIAMVEVPKQQVLGASKPEHMMSGGYHYLQDVIDSALNTTQTDPAVSFKVAAFLGVVVLAKILATGFTIGSGGSGGLLFPALFLGGITGAAYSKFLRAMHEAGWTPDSLAMTPGARAGMILVGMGGVFAACTKTPIASLVMVSEITGSYGLAVPLMMTCASAYILSRSFTMNVEQVPGIADSPAHRGDFLVNILVDMRVADTMTPSNKPEVFKADTPFKKILERIRGSQATVFPIVDEDGYLLGVFTLSDIRRIMNEPDLGNLIVAGDLGTMEVDTVTPSTNLDDALRKFTRKNVDEIPIVEESGNSGKTVSTSAIIRRPRGFVGTRRVIGLLSRRDLIGAYHRRLDAIQDAGAQEDKGSHVFVDGLTAEPADESKLAPGVPADAAHPGAELLDEPPETSGTSNTAP